MRILGAWYSNNAAHPKILTESLKSLMRAEDHTPGLAEVRTCTWDPIPGNLFKNYEPHFKLGVHLGISMQILRIMYEAEEAGELWDAVCFLEHDVLYPPWYFARIAEELEKNPDAEGVINLNYIGMRPGGWVRVNQRDEPMHQISMRWAAARVHHEWVIRECILHGARCVEPDDKRNFARIPYDEDVQPACHINHDAHFTSHSNIYATTPWLRVHPTWGDFRDYYPPEMVDESGPVDPSDPLEAAYRRLVKQPSALNEHLPTLRRYAEGCESVTDFGTYVGESATALLAAHPVKFTTYDVIERNVNFLREYAGKTAFRFVQADVRAVDIEPTDLLFIDTTHTYEHLKAELERHAPQVRRWIIIHDTESRKRIGYHSNDPKYPGMDVMHMTSVQVEGIGRALAEFLGDHPEWRTKEHFDNCNGLTVLERQA